jgi:hypothetical protein
MSLVGKGIFVWQIAAVYGGDVVRIADEAGRANLSHVVIKIADGRYRYNIANGRDLGAALISELRKRGIQAWGWQYIYGKNAAAEADLAAQLVQNLDLAGLVVNAEGEFKAKGMASVAEQYMQRLRKKIPRVPIALSSYRYPSTHYQFPFETFLKHCDINMPQVYWQGSVNPAQQLRKSVNEYKALRHSRPIVPTGSAYGFGDWTATPDQITAFISEAKSLGLPAVNFWEWAASLQDGAKLWKAIRASAWGEAPDPQGPVASDPTYIRLKHDRQWMKNPQTGRPVLSRMDMPDWNPGFHFDTYPAVVPFSALPNGGDGAYKYSRPWAQFLRASNPQNYHSLEKISAGLFNPRASQQQAFPVNLKDYDGETVAEGIGSTGNVYEVAEERAGAVRVKLIDFQSVPPKAEDLNYEDTPWLMNAFSAVAKDGSIHKTMGKDLVFPNLGKFAGWVAKERVEFFPNLPMHVAVRDRVNVRTGPGLSHNVIGELVPGNTCKVSQYAPRGSNVWGKIGENRWIALVHTTKSGTYYYTTWKMETDPPLALVHPRPYLVKPGPISQPDIDPQPDNDLISRYFAALNRGQADQVASFYNKTSSKLVAEGRKFTGQKAIYNWYLRLLNNKLSGAKFKVVKIDKQGSFYDVRWTADGKKADVRDGKHIFHVDDTRAGLINYHYTEFSLV